jgi:hypothetical protein
MYFGAGLSQKGFILRNNAARYALGPNLMVNMIPVGEGRVNVTSASPLLVILG